MVSFKLFTAIVTGAVTLVSAAPKDGYIASDMVNNFTMANLEARGALAPYVGKFTLSWKDYPESCETICFAWHCAGHSRVVHPDASLSNSNRAKNSCGKVSPNRCSTKEGHSAGFDCDEWPWAASTEGGSKASTRCIPSGDNRGSGSVWGNFINNKGSQAVGQVLGPKDTITVIIDKTTIDASKSTFCKAELGKTINCNDDKGGDPLQRIG